MMTIIDVNFPFYKLKHRNGHEFEIKASRNTQTGWLIFDPADGWNDLSIACQQDPESLLEDIDEAIYNATPEKYENE